MRTCPACGKENEDNVTRCATCDEEIGAGTAHSVDGEAQTVRVDVEEVFAAAAAHEETKGAKKDDGETRRQEGTSSNHVAVADGVPAEKPADEQEDAPSVAPRTTPVSERVGAGLQAGDTQRSAGQMTAQIPLEQLRLAGASGPSFQPGMVKLVVEQGMSVNKEYLLNDPELVIGRRDPEQEFIPDIDLFDQENANNRYISRRQARLYFQEGHLFVEDLDSSNGTCVNNRPIKPNISVQLNAGDKLLLGQSVMFRIRPMAT